MFADIVIVGAGLSGLTAAYTILEKEPTLVVMVLEGSDRLGGRTLSLPLPVGDGAFSYYDMGGQWISTRQKLIVNLVQKLDLQLVKRSDNGSVLGRFGKEEYKTMANAKQFGTVKDRIQLVRFLALVEVLSKQVSFKNPCTLENWDVYDATPMESFINKMLLSKLGRSLMTLLIRITCGLSPRKISVLFYLAFCNGTNGIANQLGPSCVEYTVKGGAQQICFAMLKKIERAYIKTKQPVTKIFSSEHGVYVETEDNAYYCSYAIVAIPPRQVLDIEHEPPLSPKRVQVLQGMNAGCLIKFVATYKTVGCRTILIFYHPAFWKQLGLLGDVYVANGDDAFVCFDVTQDSRPALTGYISCSLLKRPISKMYFFCSLKPFDDVEAYEPPFKKAVLAHLVKVFGEKASQPVSYMEKSWEEDDYLSGCPMNCPGLGLMGYYHEIRQPAGRVFWAGTETATQWNGYMEGAVQAGYSAAIEVLYRLRPSLLTVNELHYIESNQPLVYDNVNSFLYAVTNRKYMLFVGLCLAILCIGNKRCRHFIMKVQSKLINPVVMKTK